MTSLAAPPLHKRGGAARLEDDCMEAYPLRAWLQVATWTRDHGMTTIKYSIGDQHYWTIAIILAICDTITIVVASQA